MAITVGDIYTAFPTFNPKDMIALVGKDNFNGRSQVSLSKIASYQGGMAQELSIFVAQKEEKTDFQRGWFQDSAWIGYELYVDGFLFDPCTGK